MRAEATLGAGTRSVARIPPRQWLALASWVLASFTASGIGGLASGESASFYLSLQRPAWAPPSGLFGPVWTVLYTIIGVSAWFAWRERGVREAPVAFALLLAQLIANGAWTWIFFVWREGALAFAEIALLWLLIGANLVAFWRIRRIAGALLLPYLAWVTFATALTFSLWKSNPAMLGP